MAITPCYDHLTKTDCPDRCAGCSAHCDRWAEYVASRDEEYKVKLKESIAEQDYIGHCITRFHKISRAKERVKNRFGRRSS